MGVESLVVYRISRVGLTIFFLLVICLLLLVTPVHAQLEVTESYDVVSQGAVDGDIVSFTDQGVVLSERDNDNKVFGIIDTDPLLSYRRADGTGSPIVRSGSVDVNVSTANGPIKKGDLITTSTLKGKGQKSNVSGYIVGVALGDFGDKDGEAVNFTPPQGGTPIGVRVGKVNVAMRIEFAELSTARNANRLLDSFNLALFRNIQDPEKFVNILRYILAGLAIIISFSIGFFTLAKTIPKAMEALGRNPLARNTIQFGIVLNIIFIVGIALVGVVAAVILLRF